MENVMLRKMSIALAVIALSITAVHTNAFARYAGGGSGGGHVAGFGGAHIGAFAGTYGGGHIGAVGEVGDGASVVRAMTGPMATTTIMGTAIEDVCRASRLGAPCASVQA